MASITEVRNRVRAEPVGSCIYCGAVNELGDEHIVPYALGGRYELPESSCSRCAAITSAFERKVLRGFMLDARTTGGFPTRRPKKRPRSFPLDIERNGTFQTLELDPDNHPGFLLLPLLAPPSVLVGRESGTGVTIIGIETIRFGKDPAEFAHEMGATSIRGSVDLDATSFSRLLAKIGYSYAIAAVGLLPRDEIPILPLILGDADDASLWLGSALFQLSVESKKPTHAMSLVQRPDPRDNRKKLLIARIKLFAPSGATGYEVVVHQPKDVGG